MAVSQTEKTGTADRGRPREFDPVVAIAAAGKVFGDKGYHATSIDDLCEATGLLRGSLYSAFGDKKGMLLAAIDQYGEKNLARLAESLNPREPTREGLRTALLYYPRTPTVLAGRHGCLVTNTALEMLPDDPEIEDRVERIFRRMTALLSAAVIRGQAVGLFNPNLVERPFCDSLFCVTQNVRAFCRGRPYVSYTFSATVYLRL